MIYFDNASTTKVDKEVLDAMMPYFSEIYGNASSSHFFGVNAMIAIEKARKLIADLINSNESEIIFTSGATESINLALKGFAEANYEKGNHIITVKTEHKAVIETCRYLEERGFEVTYLNVNQDGLISLRELKEAIKKNTFLICIMYVNNETGVIQPIKEIGSISKENNITFFCDATQAIGKVVVDVEKDNIDMLCFSGHKLNAPKGIGILYKRGGIALTPLFHGGGQENGLRPGTYNTPLIVGLGKAAEIANQKMLFNRALIDDLSSYLIEELHKIEGIVLLGNKNNKVANIIDVVIPQLNSEIFISKKTNLSLSNGSACTSQIVESSHVLKAMGLNDFECSQSIRISINKDTSKTEIDELISNIISEVKL